MSKLLMVTLRPAVHAASPPAGQAANPPAEVAGDWLQLVSEDAKC